MFVRPDIERDGWFWVDRGIDGRADRFSPCPECAEALDGVARQGAWQESDICSSCATRLEIDGAIADVKGEKPLIFPAELQRVPDAGSPIWNPLGPVDLRRPRGEKADFLPFHERVPYESYAVGSVVSPWPSGFSTLPNVMR